MARAATSPEIAYFRTENQFSELKLAIIKPAVIFAAQVNQSFTSTDLVTSVTFDNVTTGAYTDLVAGQTMWIGTASGGKDLGICRVRSATSTVITIGRTSDVPWADNLYITVVNEHAIWAKQALWSSNHAYMDDDVAYSDQMLHPNPVAVLGPDAVLELTGATVNFTPTAAYSWTLEGTISGYSWAAPGASATASLTTAAPTITYNATGTYMVSCTIAGSNGKTSTGYRVVYVWNDANPPASQFQVDNIQGDFSAGGWSFNATLFEGADLSTVYDRAKVILFSRDWYGGTRASIGAIDNPAYNTIIATGWIAEDTIQWNPEQSSVQFQVQGANWWMDKVSTFAPGVIDVNTTPANWTQYEGLTVDAGIWHFLYWRSTVCEMMDVYLTGDTRRTASCEAPAGSLWSEIKSVGEAKLAASPLVDALGRLFVEIDSQWVPLAGRSGLPVVMDMTTADWRETLEITRQTLSNIAMYESGGFYYSGGSYLPSMAAAFGKNFKPYGLMDKRETFALNDQADCITWAGLGIGVANNDYPHVVVKLGGFSKLIDIAPRQYITASISAGDTPRGFTWTAQKLVPRTIQYNYNNKTGQILTDLDCEGASVPGAGVNIPIPQIPITPNPDVPPLPPYNPPGPWFPPSPWQPTPPDPESICKSSSPGSVNGPYGLIFSPATVNNGESATALFPCWIRQDNTYGKTEVTIYGKFNGDAQANFTLTAIDSAGSDLLSPSTKTDYDGYTTFVFAPVSGGDVAGFKITVTAGGGGGYGSFLEYYAKGAQQGSWPIQNGHPTTDNSVYEGNAALYCAANGNTNFYYWLAMHLYYNGPALPYGYIQVTSHNLSSGGYLFDAMDTSLPLHSTGGAYWFGGPDAYNHNHVNYTPGTTIDTYLVSQWGGDPPCPVTTFQITSVDWVSGGTVYVNLYPGTGWIPGTRSIYITNAEVRNICAV